MKNGEKSFAKLFELLELISHTDQGMSGKQLSQQTGIPLSTTFRMLKFMTDQDYLRSDHGLYTLGSGFVRFGNVALNQNPLAKHARPILEMLSARTRETVHLAKLHGHEITYIDKVEGSRPIRMGSLIGKYAPLYCTGIGKAIFAFLPQETQEKLLLDLEYFPFTEKTIRSGAEMQEELIKIRTAGYAFDDCEHEAGVFCVAAPILNRDGVSVAGISISGAEMYMRDHVAELSALVSAAANEISLKSGYR